MRRRGGRHEEEHVNHERWLVSYADFITLLFAFFVVMYAISSLNEGKYKVLASTLAGVFDQQEKSRQPIPVGQEAPRAIQPPAVDPGLENPAGNQDDPLKRISDTVRAALGDLISSGQVSVTGNEEWIEISLNSALLFDSGDNIPNSSAFGLMAKLGGILAPFRNPIQVQGFTDNQPIATSQYPTNWELSGARAASILRLLAMNGVAPQRLAAVGYGEYQPVADNATAAGRARNRRVVLLVSRTLDIRHDVNGVNPPMAPPAR